MQPINRLFFPDLLPAAGVLAAFATFAVGFFVRPLGGVIISQIGDRVGRKPAMILSVALMGGATVLMGLLPSAATLGVLAPLLLILLRLIQGFGAPEYVAAMESAERRRQRERLPLGALFRGSWRQVLFGFLSITGHNAWAYILNTFALSYLTTTIGLARTDALIPVLVAAFTGMLLCPFLGLAADRFGYRRIFVLGAVFAILWVVPLFLGLSSGSVVIATIVMALGFGLGFGAMAGAQGAMLVNLFPVRYRFSGVAVARELNGVLIAGPTPFIASGLVILGNQTPWLVCAYLILCCACTIGAVLAVGARGDSTVDDHALTADDPTRSCRARSSGTRCPSRWWR